MLVSRLPSSLACVGLLIILTIKCMFNKYYALLIFIFYNLLGLKHMRRAQPKRIVQ
jgi:hypothetical protein